MAFDHGQTPLKNKLMFFSGALFFSGRATPGTLGGPEARPWEPFSGLLKPLGALWPLGALNLRRPGPKALKAPIRDLGS